MMTRPLSEYLSCHCLRYGRVRRQLTQVYVQKSISTTFPRSPSSVSGSELIHDSIPTSSGASALLAGRALVAAGAGAVGCGSACAAGDCSAAAGASPDSPPQDAASNRATRNAARMKTTGNLVMFKCWDLSSGCGAGTGAGQSIRRQPRHSDSTNGRPPHNRHSRERRPCMIPAPPRRHSRESGNLAMPAGQPRLPQGDLPAIAGLARRRRFV